LAAMNAMLAASRMSTPTAGSSAAVSAGEMDATTAAMKAAEADELKQRQANVEAAEKALADAVKAADPARARIAAAEANLRAKQPALENVDEAGQAKAKQEVADAQKELDDANAAGRAVLDEQAKAEGKADVVRGYLAQLAGMAPGGSARITAA